MFGETQKKRLEKPNKKRPYVPSDNFSPESGGKAKPNNAIEAINTHGTIKLKK